MNSPVRSSRPCSHEIKGTVIPASTLQSDPTRAPANSRLARVSAWVGAALWIAGLAAGLAHFSAAGIALRCIGLAALTFFTLRRGSLTRWTLLAMLAGVELGYCAPHYALHARLASDLFLRLIRMIVAPLLFSTMVAGIAGHSQLRSVGRVALKALIFFEVVTTLGLIFGSLAMNLAGAGWGIALPSESLSQPAGMPQAQSWQQFLLHMFPENIAAAVAQDQILQVAVFSVLFGVAMAMLPEAKKSPLLSVLKSLADTMFQLTRIVMVLAPLASGAAIAYTVGNTGLAALLPLARLLLIYAATLVAFCLLVLLPTLLAFRIPVGKFLHAIAEPASIGFATTTSEAALPLAMERMEEFGVPRWIVSFVMPAGYSFNMIGTSVYLSMAAVFTAQAGGIHLSIARQVGLLATLMIASKGVAGVPRAVLVVLLATASSLGLPMAPIILILGIDALMDMARTAMNVAGNCMACAIVARSEGYATSEHHAQPAELLR